MTCINLRNLLTLLKIRIRQKYNLGPSAKLIWPKVFHLPFLKDCSLYCPRFHVLFFTSSWQDIWLVFPSNLGLENHEITFLLMQSHHFLGSKIYFFLVKSSLLSNSTHFDHFLGIKNPIISRNLQILNSTHFLIRSLGLKIVKTSAGFHYDAVNSISLSQKSLSSSKIHIFLVNSSFVCQFDAFS